MKESGCLSLHRDGHDQHKGQEATQIREEAADHVAALAQKKPPDWEVVSISTSPSASYTP